MSPKSYANDDWKYRLLRLSRCCETSHDQECLENGKILE